MAKWFFVNVEPGQGDIAHPMDLDTLDEYEASEKFDPKKEKGPHYPLLLREDGTLEVGGNGWWF